MKRQPRKPEFHPLQVVTSKEVCPIVNYCDQQLRRLEAQGVFPKRTKFGKNRAGWLWYQIEQWLIDRARTSGARIPPHLAPSIAPEIEDTPAPLPTDAS